MINPETISIEGQIYTMPIATCERCGHIWPLRLVAPTYCPSCRSNHWNSTEEPFTKQEVVRRICTHLGSIDLELLCEDKTREEIL